MLAKLGFGLDIKKCVVTGSENNLEYLSPKSGHAVCLEAGEPYKSKLFKLSKILIEPDHIPTIIEILDTMKISTYFFEKHIFIQHNITFPSARNVLQEALQANIIGSYDSCL